MTQKVADQSVQHETRRHEQEHAKTRETLFKLMNGKHTATLSSLTLNEPLPTHVLGLEENDVQEVTRLLYAAQHESHRKMRRGCMQIYCPKAAVANKKRASNATGPHGFSQMSIAQLCHSWRQCLRSTKHPLSM